MRYAQIRNMDISNGENIGVSLFVQGCRFQCKNCFNKETWDFNGGKEWDEKIKNEFFKLIDRPYIKRVSILGGEPLVKENVFDVFNLIFEIKEKFPDKTLWLYTGYQLEDIINNPLRDVYTTTRKRIIEMCDVLIDGRYVDELRDLTLKFRGSSNQRVIDVKQSLKENKIILYNN